MLLALGEVKASGRREIIRIIVAIDVGLSACNREESHLDEREHGGVIADGVRDVVRFRKGRNPEDGDAHAELVKGGAVIGIRASRIGGEFRSEFLGGQQRCVGFAEGILAAVRAAAGQQARRGFDSSAHCPGKMPSGVRSWPWRAAGDATWS